MLTTKGQPPPPARGSGPKGLAQGFQPVRPGSPFLQQVFLRHPSSYLKMNLGDNITFLNI